MKLLNLPNSDASIPSNVFENDVPLVAVLRGDYVASMHRGIWCAVDTGGHEVASAGDESTPTFLRSGAKPLQVLPAILSGAIDRFSVSQRELAVLCASHHGEPQHVDAVLSVLNRAGIDPSALACGIHSPISETSAVLLARNHKSPSPLHNNCSGAHAGMLLACRGMGWGIEGYGNPDHPLQKWTRRILEQFTDLSPDRVQCAVDDCAVPTFRIPIRAAALAFARLANPAGLEPQVRQAAERVRNAMTTYPAMVGGARSFDTRLMQAADGALVCKGGADGFQGIGISSRSAGIALKISDGAARAIPPAAINVLRRMDALSEQAARELASDASPEMVNRRGEPVGRLVAIQMPGSA
ncbi:MAG: asparaginase [Chloroflexota bacterium]